MKVRTINVGHVHVLTGPQGTCIPGCPHPDHSPACDHPRQRFSESANGFRCLDCYELIEAQ